MMIVASKRAKEYSKRSPDVKVMAKTVKQMMQFFCQANKGGDSGLRGAETLDLDRKLRSGGGDSGPRGARSLGCGFAG